jgi:hypothetical protein
MPCADGSGRAGQPRGSPRMTSHYAGPRERWTSVETPASTYRACIRSSPYMWPADARTGTSLPARSPLTSLVALLLPAHGRFAPSSTRPASSPTPDPSRPGPLRRRQSTAVERHAARRAGRAPLRGPASRTARLERLRLRGRTAPARVALQDHSARHRRARRRRSQLGRCGVDAARGPLGVAKPPIESGVSIGGAPSATARSASPRTCSAWRTCPSSARMTDG